MTTREAGIKPGPPYKKGIEMKDKKIGISKVAIQIGDKEVTLTVEQARELRDALNELLGEKVIERVIEHDRYYPYVAPYVYTYPKYWSVKVGDQPDVYGTITATTATTCTCGDFQKTIT